MSKYFYRQYKYFLFIYFYNNISNYFYKMYFNLFIFCEINQSF